jgi:hypothetical protein
MDDLSRSREYVTRRQRRDARCDSMAAVTKHRRPTQENRMRSTFQTSLLLTTAVVAALLLGACGKKDAPPQPQTDATTNIVPQATVPPPPGDATPKPADTTTRQAVEGSNEKTGNPGDGSQSTVGSAASGSPPYSLNGAPEGNVAPKGGDAPKK